MDEKDGLKAAESCRKLQKTAITKMWLKLLDVRIETTGRFFSQVTIVTGNYVLNVLVHIT